MNRKLKIINIASHLPLLSLVDNPEEYCKKFDSKYIRIEKLPYWVGFFKGDHHDNHARETLKRTDKYLIECWRPYGEIIDRVYSETVEGIIHKVFPSKSVYFPYIGTWMKSSDMLRELKNEITKHHVLIHFHDGHSRFIRWLIFKLKNEKVPVVYQHRSNCFKNFKYKNFPLKGKMNITILYDYIREIKSLEYIDHYFSGSLVEKKFLKTKLNLKKFSYLKSGVDFNFYKPAEDRMILRQKLNLPMNKFIVLYVGRFDKGQNIDILIRSYKRIKKNHKAIELLLVGGYQSDEFYKMGKDAGAIMVERISTLSLLEYYQAANIYVLPAIDYLIVNFGGFGTAPIEALACGLPMISNNIIHFPGTVEERDKIGMTMESEEILEKNIVYMAKNMEKFKDCRAIAGKYFDINVTMKTVSDKYDELFKLYYC